MQAGENGASLEAGGRVERRSRAPGQTTTATGPDDAPAGPDERSGRAGRGLEDGSTRTRAFPSVGPAAAGRSRPTGRARPRHHGPNTAEPRGPWGDNTTGISSKPPNRHGDSGMTPSPANCHGDSGMTPSPTGMAPSPDPGMGGWAGMERLAFRSTCLPIEWSRERLNEAYKSGGGRRERPLSYPDPRSERTDGESTDP